MTENAPTVPITQVADQQTFQDHVHPWMLECFGKTITSDRDERNRRFLEEALELVQSLGCTRDQAHQLVDYVFDRSAGESRQEVGGVMVTLAALCLANGFEMHADGEAELVRIHAPEIMASICVKQVCKSKHTSLLARPSSHKS